MHKEGGRSPQEALILFNLTGKGALFKGKFLFLPWVRIEEGVRVPNQSLILLLVAKKMLKSILTVLKYMLEQD